MKHLPRFIDPVDPDIEIKQIKNPSRHIDVFRKDAGAIDTADEHVLESLEDTSAATWTGSSGTPSRR
jgi:hypothetical protein